jgi:hypothetical protein
MYIGLHYNTRYSSQILMKLDFSWQIFEKYSNIKFHENCSVGAELLHSDGQTDMMKLVVTLCNFANIPKNTQVYLVTNPFSCPRNETVSK